MNSECKRADKKMYEGRKQKEKANSITLLSMDSRNNFNGSNRAKTTGTHSSDGQNVRRTLVFLSSCSILWLFKDHNDRGVIGSQAALINQIPFVRLLPAVSFMQSGETFSVGVDRA